MPLYSCILSTLLVGQAAGGPPATAPAQTPRGDEIGARSTGFSGNAENISSKTGTKIAPTRAKSDQLLAEALTRPADGAASGQSLTLLSTIASMGDRKGQLEAIHGYWRLVQAIGDYHYLLERQQRLSRVAAAKDEAGDLRTAQAVATARLHEAEIRVTSAQHELAATLHLAETAALPWPADRPLTEAYRTRFAELFAGKRPPDRADVGPDAAAAAARRWKATPRPCWRRKSRWTRPSSFTRPGSAPWPACCKSSTPKYNSSRRSWPRSAAITTTSPTTHWRSSRRKRRPIFW